jgi:tetratricopeptide (TPR) repeat protein
MMRRPSATRLTLPAILALLLAAVVAPAGPAHAQAEPERRLEEGAPATAEQRYDIGIALYRAGRYAEAAAEFDAALALFPTSGKLAYNLARCRERADQLRPAVDAYRRYLQNAPAAEDRAEVETLIARLEERIDARRPTVKVVTTPEGATVRATEGTALGQAPLTLRLDPGVHVLRFSLDGHADEVREITVAEGETRAVTVELEATAPP